MPSASAASAELSCPDSERRRRSALGRDTRRRTRWAYVAACSPSRTLRTSFTARAACVRHRRRKFVDNTGRGHQPDHADGDPRPAAVTFVTTEHFTLQGARSSTISESTGRASVFLGAVSGGLICPRARRHRRQDRRGVLHVRAHSPAHAGLRGTGDVPPGAADRDRGPCIRAAYRPAPRLLLRSRSRAGRLPAQPRGTAAYPGTGDRTLAAIPDRRRDGRRDHRDTGAARPAACSRP